MEHGGELLIRAERRLNFLQLDVIDTGPGIPPENLARIWELYFSTKKGGSGMGLPTVRRIIEEHHGTVDVHSEVGKGTCFTLLLPLATSARPSAAAAL
jgi:signal transduction histidine kinase